jgi:hypothetical protein
MHRILLGLLTTVAVVSLSAACSADDVYPTNIELVERTLKAAVDSMDLRPPAAGVPDLQIVTSSGGDASWLLDSVLKGRLLEMGWRVRVAGAAADSNPDGGYQLTLNVIDLGLKYGRSWRRFLLVGKAVERIARANIYYELIDKKTGKLVASATAKSESRDVVPASRLATLSDERYEFANPEIKKSQWDRYVEGGLVLVIVGILVYLFYSNKTAS